MAEETTKPGMLEALDRIGKEAQFRADLIEDADKALEGYQLEPAQKTSLVDIARGFAADAQASREAAVKAATKWYQPGSFKELAAAFLSFMLLILLFVAAFRTYGLISTPPAGATIGETVVQWSAFDRATTFFSTLFPLFAAVVTFYLGVAIESRRADKAEESADKAQGQVEDATKRAGQAQAQAENAKQEAGEAQAQAEEAKQEARAEKAKSQEIEDAALEVIRKVGVQRGALERLGAPQDSEQANEALERLQEVLAKYA
jgi:hypothetical protein